MKVYFTASIAGKKQYLPNYQRIVEEVEALGHEIMTEHIISHTESQIRLETKEERLGFHKKLEKWIREADCMIVEASFPSISVGYEISLAIHNHKPVLIVYTEGDPPALMQGFKEEAVVCERYTGDDLKGIIRGFLDYVGGKNDLRFTFYLTAEQMEHLRERAREKRMPRAVYLRELIEKDRG